MKHAVVYLPVSGFTRRAFLKTTAAALAVARVGGQALSRETLYNGIVLPSPWPPRRAELSDIPQTPPYLLSPPAIINIDTGRQLFVDDFLIEESSLYRQFHPATYHSANPILTPEREWEMRDPQAVLTGNTPSPTAMPFSDGVFYDPAERIFKMWYMAGYQQATALAVSLDGIKWERPRLSVVPGTNIVSTAPRDSNTVWLDLESANHAERFKMAGYDLGLKALRLFTSPDGIHWAAAGTSGSCGDRSTFFRNPFRKNWTFSLRHDGNGMRRVRQYYETPTFSSAAWTAADLRLWIGADEADLARADMPSIPRQLYNLDAAAYESVMVGLLGIFRGEPSNREKPIDLCVAFSRDGFHWSREPREPFIGVSETQGAWNWANVQSAGGVCTIAGDQLRFYVSGRKGVPGTQLPGICSTGLATLRRDGFASVSDTWPPRAPRQIGLRPGLTTRPLTFSGRHLFVNADVNVDARGELRVEVLDRSGRPIEGFKAEQCVAIREDSTKIAVSWSGDADLGRLSGQVVRFRFVPVKARLFAFWVSRSERGESGGFIAGGGPGFSSYRDL